MSDLTLLHLTDLHFGWDRDPTKVAERELVLDRLIDRIAHLHEWRPDVVCIGGDIGWRGNTADYAKARDWLQRLLNRIGLGFADVVVCPGNHDVDRTVTGRLARPRNATEADDILQVPLADHNLKAFDAFSKFCQDAGITPYSFQGTTSYLLGHVELKGARFVACNSSWFCKGEDDKDNLWVGLPLIKVIEAAGGLQTPGAPMDKPIVCLVHHPPDWWHQTETHAYDSRPNTLDYLARRCHLILTGHTHAEVRRSDVIAEAAVHLTGGAAYGGAAHPNSVRLVRLTAARLSYRSFEFDPRSADALWREHGEQTLPFGAGPPGYARAAPAAADEGSDLARLRSASQAAAKSLIEGKSRQIKPTGRIPDLRTFPVLVRVTEQSDRYDPDGHLRLDSDQSVALPLEEAVHRAKRSVLFGDLGSGKTTLAAALIVHRMETSPTSVAFLIPARSLVLPDNFQLDDVLAACGVYVKGQIAPTVEAVNLRALLRADIDLTLVIDGLDEVPKARAARLLRQLALLSDNWPTLSVLVTGRPVELAGVSYESWGLCRVPVLGDSERLSLFAAEARATGLGAAEAEVDAQQRLNRLRRQPSLVEVATTPLATRLVCPRLSASSFESLTLGDLLYELLQERLSGWDARDERTSPASAFLERFASPTEMAEVLGELALRMFAAKPLSKEAAESALCNEFAIRPAVAAQALHHFEAAGLLTDTGQDVDIPSQPFQDVAAGVAILARWSRGDHRPLTNDSFRCYQFAAAVARRRKLMDRYRAQFGGTIEELLGLEGGMSAACFVASESRDPELARAVVAILAKAGRRPLPGLGDRQAAGHHAIAHTLWLAGEEGWTWFHTHYLDARYPIIHRGSGIVEEIFHHWAWFAKDSLTEAQRGHLAALVRPLHAVGGLFGILPCLALLLPDEFGEPERLWYWSGLLGDDLFGDIVERLLTDAQARSDRSLLLDVLSRRAHHHVRAAVLYARLFPDEPTAWAVKSLVRRWAVKPDNPELRTLLDRFESVMGATRWAQFLRWCLSDPDGQTAAAAALLLYSAGERRLAMQGDPLVKGLHDGGYVRRAEEVLAAIVGADPFHGVRWLAMQITTCRSLYGASSALWRLLHRHLDPNDADSPNILVHCTQGIGEFLLARYPEVRDGFRRLLGGPSGAKFREALTRGLNADRSDIRHGCAAVLVVSNPAGEPEALSVLAFDRDQYGHLSHEWEEFLLGLAHGPTALASLGARMQQFHSRARALALALSYRARMPLPRDDKAHLFSLLLDLGNSHLVNDAELAKGPDAALWRSVLERLLNGPSKEKSRQAASLLTKHFDQMLSADTRAACRARIVDGGYHPDALREEVLHVLEDAEYRGRLQGTFDSIHRSFGRPSVIEHAARVADDPAHWGDVIWSLLFGGWLGHEVEDCGRVLLDIGREYPEYRCGIGEAALSLMGDSRTVGRHRCEARQWLALIADEFGGLTSETICEEVLRSNVLERAALRALLARLGRVPEGFAPPDLRNHDFPADLGQIPLTALTPESTQSELLDCARDASQMLPETCDRFERVIFALAPDREWLRQCEDRGINGRMIAEAVRFCIGDAASARNLAELARRPNVPPSVGSQPAFIRLNEIVSTAKNVYLACAPASRDEYAKELCGVIRAEGQFVAFAGAELLAIGRHLPDELVEIVLEDLARHHTAFDGEFAGYLARWAADLITGQPNDRLRDALGRAARLLDSLDNEGRLGGGSSYAHLFFPLGLWCQGCDPDPVTIRLYLRGLSRAFAVFSDESRRRPGPSVLAVLHPLLSRVPEGVWQRILDSELLRGDLTVRSLLTVCSRLTGAAIPGRG